ncbi:signal peptidase I [Patescibacteria group bacterium]|nr:signal peptidase I [Patescibacteria group bacterium]
MNKIKKGLKKNNSIKKLLKDFWYLLWKDDSFKGWIFSVIFLFIFIRFVFFPFLILITGTPIPLAIVESCSMHHTGGLFSSLDSWWENREETYSHFDIDKEDFLDFSLKRGFTKGDILFVIRANPEKLEVGDVIIFDANQRYPIIHRIVEIKEVEGKRVFSTFGDNYLTNPQQLNFEKNIPEENVLGKAAFKIVPYAGWVKLIFYEWQKGAEQRGFC